MDNVLKELKKKIAPWYKNLRGWRTDRKIVVIESDDWGSIRMPSKEVYNKCLEAGYKVDKIAYERYDSLASEEDLERLFDLLLSFNDHNGNHPVFTANVLTANPDFKKIKESGFSEYFYESVIETFKRYSKHEKCFQFWLNGLREKIFFPQSHGREHLNVSMFMDALQREDKDALFGFKHRMPGSIPHGDSTGGNKYVETLKYSGESDKNHKLRIILDGLDQFENLFGFRSESLIPPNYLWNPDYNEAVAKKGVRYFQGNRKMKEPKMNGKVRYHSYKLGENNKYGQVYLLRNCIFEPALSRKGIDRSVDRCFKNIYAAFAMNKPAIICSHRINYVGYIDQENGDRNLKKLQELLNKIQKRWPDVEFMNSVELGKMIRKDLTNYLRYD